MWNNIRIGQFLVKWKLKCLVAIFETEYFIIGCCRCVYMLVTGKSCITKRFRGNWWCTYFLRWPSSCLSASVHFLLSLPIKTVTSLWYVNQLFVLTYSVSQVIVAPTWWAKKVGHYVWRLTFAYIFKMPEWISIIFWHTSTSFYSERTVYSMFLKIIIQSGTTWQN